MYKRQGLGTAGVGTVTVANGATLDLQGVTVAAKGGTTINGGTISTTTGTSSYADGITLGANSTVDVDGTQLTLSGVIGDGGGTFNLTKTGNGILVLSGANTYDGNTAINAGTVNVTHATGLGSAGSGTVTIANGTTLDIQNVVVAAKGGTTITGGTISTTAGTSSYADGITLAANSTVDVDGTQLTLSGVINDGAGNNFGLTKTGNGILVLSGANTYGGNVALNAGTINVTNANGLGSDGAGTVTVANGTTLDIQNVTVAAKGGTTINGGTISATTGTSSYADAITLGANSTVDVDGTQLTLSGVINDGAGNNFGLTKTGNGILVLSGANTYGGAVALNAGTINVTNANGLGSDGAGTCLLYTSPSPRD